MITSYTFTAVFIFAAPASGVKAGNRSALGNQNLFCEDQYKGQQQTTFQEFVKQTADQSGAGAAAESQVENTRKFIGTVVTDIDGSSTHLLEPMADPYIALLAAAPGDLKYRVVNLQIPNDYPRSTSKTVSVFFDNLKLNQFEYLKKTFGLGQSELKYDPTIQYRLQDFLPAPLQAVADWYTYTQCTGFIAMYLDATRTRTRISTGWAHHDATIDRLQNTNYFRRVKHGERLYPGDILVAATPESAGTITTEREYVIGHIYIYLDENLSLGANPGGIQYGTYIGSNYLKNGIFSGKDIEVSFEKPLKEDVGLLVYRRVNWSDEPLEFRKYKNGAPILALPLVADQLGRLKVDRKNILSCGE